MQISGLHHVTSMASDPQANIDFYTQILGLRLVKVTVNFDAPEVYHLYYGDATATPGSILTFFPFLTAPRFRAGVGQTNATAFAVPSTSLDFWRKHLVAKTIKFTESERFGETVLSFTDHDSTVLELVAHTRADTMTDNVMDMPTVPAEHAIRGFHSVTLWHSDQDPTARLLTEIFGLEKIGEEGDRVRYQTQSDDLARQIDIVTKRATIYGSGGAGSVHHVAWRVPDDPAQAQWQELLHKAGLRVTPVKDRQYFHSIYFREPGGVLFEIATDNPGFTLDEALDELGQDLKLPPWLEAQREQIETNLLTINRPTLNLEA